MNTLNNSNILLLILIAWNLIAFIVMGIDKRKAVKSKWRIPERALFLIAFIFGGIGIFLGMHIFRHKTKNNSFRILVPIAIVLNIIAALYMFKFTSAIEVTNYDIVSNKVPAEFNGFKIVQISDFHNGTFDDNQNELIDKIKAQNPNIIVITGDLIDEIASNSDAVNKLIDEVTKLSPVYFITGNHDMHYRDFNGLSKMMINKGVIILDNKKAVLRKRNSHINLYGIADPNMWDYLNPERYVKSEMEILKPQDGFNILLFHRANMFDTIKGNGYQLVLSGHMHGGQIQIPFWGGLKSPNGSWFPKYAQGEWHEDGTTMIVSRGLGNIVSVPRLFNPPEIVSVTLKAK